MISKLKNAAAVMAIALIIIAGPASAQETFTPDQIKSGADVYGRNCAPCHGARMQDPESAFNLRKFPPDQRERFERSVTNGKNQMPPWGDMLQPGELQALWAYVMAGER